MIVHAWRLVQTRHAANAFDGEGAARYPGRWNHRGTPMVYTAGSLSLAALEILVQVADPALFASCTAIGITFPDEFCERPDVGTLPPDWRGSPIRPASRDFGTAWAAGGRSPVLAVPSAVIPVETNYLLNPRHPDFAGVAIGPPEPFPWDTRLTGAR